MKYKVTRIIGASLIMTLWVGLAVYAWLKPADGHSVAERRTLEQKPTFTMEAFVSGDYAKAFESYTLDQFPMRDGFRQVKSMFSYFIQEEKLSTEEIQELLKAVENGNEKES